MRELRWISSRKMSACLVSFRRYLEEYGVYNFVRDRGLLLSRTTCDCGHSMTLRSKGKLTAPALRCSLCRKWKSAKMGTFFEDRRTHLTSFLLVIKAWVLKRPFLTIVRDCEMADKTVRSILRQLRDLIAGWLMTPSRKIGGVGRTVEMDVSLVGERDKCRFLTTKWIVGGIDRHSKECFLTGVDQWDTRTLSRVISEFVTPGTTVLTDCWHGCKTSGLISRGYDLYRYRLSSDRNIQRDEERQVGRMCDDYSEKFLVEHLWRAQYDNDPECLFDDVFEAIKAFFPVT